MSELSPICPGTGQVCEGRIMLIRGIEGLGIAHLNTSFMRPPLPISPESERAARQDVAAAQAARADSLRRDLDTPCRGAGLCAPLGQAASRFILGGPSQNEALGGTY